MVEESELYVCQQCGHCCQGETTVSLDENDVKRMVSFLKMDESEVRERYWRVTNTIIQMKIVDSHCIFFNGGCTIHPGKPWRCSQWPLHPSILTDRANFEAIKSSCPGISRQLSYEKFCEKLSVYLDQKEEK
jgi:Fe-S-cluster containining protein